MTSTKHFEQQHNRQELINLPRQIEQARSGDFDSNQLYSTGVQQETIEESDQFVSDFSDEDFNAEDEVERSAVRFVEEFQTWLNQNKEFQNLMRTSITDLMGLHRALEEENFAHELRCLAYVFEGDLRNVP